MPRKRASTFKSKRPTYSIILLLVIFFLTKLGSIPLFILKSTLDLFRLSLIVIKNVLSLILNTPYLILHSIPHHKKPGRPRKQPLSRIYLKKANRFQKKIPYKTKIAVSLFTLAFIISTYTFLTFSLAKILPSPTELKTSDKPITTEIYDRNGVLLFRLYEGRNRTLVKLEDLPANLKNATISIEDKNFYKHHGVDFMAIGRAIRTNFNNGTVQGASTITQQLIKNSLLSPEKTYQRKLKEVVLAFWAETLYSKDEILQMYFNETPYGGPTWGIEAASLTYFGKNAKDLNLAESAYLAGLPGSPTQFSPYGSQPELAKIRQQTVLERMVEEGYITRDQENEALNTPLNIQPPTTQIKAPHFVWYVKDYLSEKYGARAVSQGGLKVTTTLDLGMQEEIEQIVKDEVKLDEKLNVHNGAAMVIDAKTGQILSMVGSKDYFDPKFGNFNVALSPRQPGSSIKVITYAEAFKQGFNPATIVLDVPIRFPDGYSPVNYDGRFHGPVTIRTALGSSYNIPAVKMLASVGVPNMIETAKDMGVSSLEASKNYGLSLTLGGGEVKMIEMMAVYDTLSQNGSYQKPTPILKVTDSDGNVLDEYSDESKQVLQPEIAYLITSILADNNARTPAFGPNSLLNISGHQVAVKTGTSDLKKDNWTFGYTPDYVVGVWVGNNDNSPMNPSLTSGITGAAPIWNKIMRGLLAKKEPVAFKRPPGIIDINLNGRKDIAVGGILPKNLVRISQERNRTTYFDAYSAFATNSATAANPGLVH